MQHVGCSLRVLPYGLWHCPAETTLLPYSSCDVLSGRKKFSNVVITFGIHCHTDTVIALEKQGPVISCVEMAQHTMTRVLCSGRSWSWCGFVGDQYRQFCFFTEPLRENIASSLMMRKLSRSACVCTICWQQQTFSALCAAVNSWMICSLYG
jgi:hypothetical protein